MPDIDLDKLDKACPYRKLQLEHADMARRIGEVIDSRGAIDGPIQHLDLKREERAWEASADARRESLKIARDASPDLKIQFDYAETPRDKEAADAKAEQVVSTHCDKKVASLTPPKANPHPSV